MLSRYKNRHFINLGLFCHVKILIYPPYINDFRVATLLNYTKIFTNVLNGLKYGQYLNARKHLLFMRSTCCFLFAKI